MYRKPTKRQSEARARKLEAMRRGKDRARMERKQQGRAPDLPLLRRRVIVTDYDTGQPVTHTLDLYRTRRIDQYRAEADGKPWKEKIGWSKILEKLRKSHQRLPSPRSDFWW